MGKLNLYFIVCMALACFGPVELFAQKGLAKTVVDANTRLPLDYVSVQSNDNRIKLLSNKDGKFIVINDKGLRSFTFYKMGYSPLTISTSELLTADSIFLHQKKIVLQEVTVSSEKLEARVKDKHYYVEDYSVLPNGNFLLITSRSTGNEFEVCYYHQDKGILQTKKIRAESDPHFVTDCFKNLHVVSNRFSRQVFFDSDSSFEFLPKVGRDKFDITLAPCVLRIDTQVIMKQMLPPAPMDLPHFSVNQNSPFMNYVRVSRHAREPFYFVEYNARMREMITYEVSDHMLFGGIGYKEECGIMMFFNKIAAPLYAPLFLKNDTVVLFDFQEHHIVFLDKVGTVLQLVKMDQEQFATLYDFEVLYDAPVQKFYLKMRDANRSYVKRIDIYSGKIDKTVKLERIFAKKIQVVNDNIYYLVREKGWDDTQYLYQQN